MTRKGLADTRRSTADGVQLNATTSNDRRWRLPTQILRTGDGCADRGWHDVCTVTSMALLDDS